MTLWISVRFHYYTRASVFLSNIMTRHLSLAP